MKLFLICKFPHRLCVYLVSINVEPPTMGRFLPKICRSIPGRGTFITTFTTENKSTVRKCGFDVQRVNGLSMNRKSLASRECFTNTNYTTPRLLTAEVYLELWNNLQHFSDTKPSQDLWYSWTPNVSQSVKSKRIIRVSSTSLFTVMMEYSKLPSKSMFRFTVTAG